MLRSSNPRGRKHSNGISTYTRKTGRSELNWQSGNIWKKNVNLIFFTFRKFIVNSGFVQRGGLDKKRKWWRLQNVGFCYKWHPGKSNRRSDNKQAGPNRTIKNLSPDFEKRIWRKIAPKLWSPKWLENLPNLVQGPENEWLTSSFLIKTAKIITSTTPPPT